MRKTITLSILLLIVISIAFIHSVYLPITGTVIDAETGNPVEGAVVLVEWTKTKGIGLTYTESYKVIETLTDKEGKFSLSGAISPLVTSPYLTIYKKGYVAWNNKFIFPNYERRTDFAWSSGRTFKLDKFLSTYSYIKHLSFVAGATHAGLADEKKKLFEKYYDDSEKARVMEEQKELDRSRGLIK